MITRAVTIEDIDDLYLTCNSHINGSALYRRALRDSFESHRQPVHGIE